MLEVIKNRRSVTEFSDQEIKKEDLIDLCHAGFMAPSARGQKSCAFVIVDDKEVIDKLSLVSPGAKVVSRAKAVIAVICPNKDELLTPHMVLEDLGAVTENILLEATSKGIGSCWIGIAPDEERMSKVKAVLNLDDKMFSFCLIALGYPLNDNSFYQKDKIRDEHIYFNKVK